MALTYDNGNNYYNHNGLTMLDIKKKVRWWNQEETRVRAKIHASLRFIPLTTN